MTKIQTETISANCTVSFSLTHTNTVLFPSAGTQCQNVNSEVLLTLEFVC